MSVCDPGLHRIRSSSSTRCPTAAAFSPVPALIWVHVMMQRERREKERGR